MKSSRGILKLMAALLIVGAAFVFYSVSQKNPAQKTRSTVEVPGEVAAVVAATSSTPSESHVLAKTFNGAAQTFSPTQLTTSPQGGVPQRDITKADRISKAEFENLTQKALESLPKNEEFKNLTPDETHQMPTLMIEKIQVMATIVDAVEQNPDLELSAIGFYKTCAEKDSLVSIVRARCYSHLKELSLKNGKPVDARKIPARIAKLADYL